MKDVILVAHDIRSTHNVGSLLRTAEGLGVKKVYLTGYTPYPVAPNDTRLPHIATKLDLQISKTALGAETMIEWQHQEEVVGVLESLRSDGYQIVALEQDKTSIPLPEFESSQRVAVLIGREVEGIDPELLKLSDVIVEIPMQGGKESFNVVQATAMTLYQILHAS